MKPVVVAEGSTRSESMRVLLPGFRIAEANEPPFATTW